MFKFYKQRNAKDCGPACLLMVAGFYGKHYGIEQLRNEAGYGKDGVSLLGLNIAATNIGLQSEGVTLNFEQLKGIKMPTILHWNQNHFVVLLVISRKGERIKIADPAKGVFWISKQTFLTHWASVSEQMGIALKLAPTKNFFSRKIVEPEKVSWRVILNYLKQSRWQVIQVVAAFLLVLLFQLIFPFLTQSIVDTGIASSNLSYIKVVLLAQLMLTFSRTIVEFIRSRVLLRISVSLNSSLLSDFWIKLMQLPIRYFDSYHTGDTLQRLNDGKKIESFLTGSTLNVFFSFFSFVTFATVLVLFNIQLFVIYMIGSVLYFLWVRVFLKIRYRLNYENFHISANANNNALQMVQGMQEIKLYSAEQIKRWEWEDLQATSYKLSFKTQSYNQLQQAGSLLINEGKNIVITFMVAMMVIDGRLSLGSMLAVQYIIGQLSNPIEQFVSFMQSVQDAKISMERLNEIHTRKNEEPIDEHKLHELPINKSITLNNLSFAYPGDNKKLVLDQINLHVAHNQTTAIVGMSGSGKTTLLKLLLKFYDDYQGYVYIGDTDFLKISPVFWRKQCGSVLQDGYIFSDTIEKNITIGDPNPSMEKLISACKTADILSFIEELPNRFSTRLGSDGISISQGQKQRLLIARAIYKDPAYLFFDEATNALDGNTENVIVKNLDSFCKNRTVVVVAHRLSTVKKADKIVVLHEGRIIEEGTHEELSIKQGYYFDLIKNQLELGK